MGVPQFTLYPAAPLERLHVTALGSLGISYWIAVTFPGQDSFSSFQSCCITSCACVLRRRRQDPAVGRAPSPRAESGARCIFLIDNPPPVKNVSFYSYFALTVTPATSYLLPTGAFPAPPPRFRAQSAHAVTARRWLPLLVTGGIAHPCPCVARSPVGTQGRTLYAIGDAL